MSAVGKDSQKLGKQVCTNNDAAFQCTFLFNIFSFSGYNLIPLTCTIDIKLIQLDFAIDCSIFTMWLQTDGWTGRWTDQSMDWPMDGQKLPSYTEMIDWSINDDFPTNFAILKKQYGPPTNRGMDGSTPL